jgi:hypothetical protein
LDDVLILRFGAAPRGTFRDGVLAIVDGAMTDVGQEVGLRRGREATVISSMADTTLGFGASEG